MAQRNSNIQTAAFLTKTCFSYLIEATIASKFLISQEHYLYKLGKEGNEDGQFTTPYGLLVDSSNNLLVCDSGNSRVQQFSLDGHFTGKSITHLSKPKLITIAPDGRILVTSNNDKKVYILK